MSNKSSKSNKDNAGDADDSKDVAIEVTAFTLVHRERCLRKAPLGPRDLVPIEKDRRAMKMYAETDTIQLIRHKVTCGAEHGVEYVQILRAAEISVYILQHRSYFISRFRMTRFDEGFKALYKQLRQAGLRPGPRDAVLQMVVDAWNRHLPNLEWPPVEVI